MVRRRHPRDRGAHADHGRRLRHGDADHAVRFLRLRGGDVNGDFVGVPASQLAVFPGTTHFNGLARTALVLDAVTTFLDGPTPGSTS